VAGRIRAVLDVVAAERVTLTTDCGMKQLPRTVARAKLAALTQGAAIVRAELEGTAPPVSPTRHAAGPAHAPWLGGRAGA
jgi:5-methyltetrahydropteroyltriglutamate--homocysteine methyltransferase